MPHSDTTPLRRAAYLLLASSVLRWGWAHRPDPTATDSAPAPHLQETAARVERSKRASRPLDQGELIDPNTADAIDLDRLPGIGPSTAAAIVESRATDGPFASVDDLGRVRGVGPSTVARIRPRLGLAATRPARSPAPPRRTPPSGARRIDVNSATLEELQTLPRIGPVIAARIVEERSKRPFSSADDLARVRGVGPVTLNRLRALVHAGRRR